MKKRESIDIILCCYNQEAYIEQALRSIITQKVEAEVRVIVADDNSSDRTLAIIQELQPLSPFQLTYLTDTHNLGINKNYQRAINQCTADYVAILEGDDWWSSTNHLEQHRQFLSEHPHYSMSFNRIDFYNQNTDKHQITFWPAKHRTHLKISLKDQIVYGNQIGNLTACMFRNKLLQELPESFYDLNFADWELGMMMALHGPIALLREPTSTYRINDQGLWSSLDSDARKQSESTTLEQIAPFLPPRCQKYIAENKRTNKSSTTPPYLLTCKQRVKIWLKQHIKKANTTGPKHPTGR